MFQCFRQRYLLKIHSRFSPEPHVSTERKHIQEQKVVFVVEGGIFYCDLIAFRCLGTPEARKRTREARKITREAPTGSSTGRIVSFFYSKHTYRVAISAHPVQQPHMRAPHGQFLRRRIAQKLAQNPIPSCRNVGNDESLTQVRFPQGQ